jgi:hypothetical protein
MNECAIDECARVDIRTRVRTQEVCAAATGRYCIFDMQRASPILGCHQRRAKLLHASINFRCSAAFREAPRVSSSRAGKY